MRTMGTNPRFDLNTPAYVRVRTQLVADIIAGVWPAGAHLGLAELERHYGISQSPIREALLRLEGDGIVSLRAHRGAVVPVLDAALLTEIYDIIGSLQAMLARRAALRATATDLAQVATHVETFEAALRAVDVPAAVAANARLHATINALGGNRRAEILIETRFSLIQALRQSIGYSAGRIADVQRQHRELLTALQARDSEAAERLMALHADTARDDLIARLQGQMATKGSA
jgi:DNA-binding GntR family transcriptional regulator